MAVDFFNNDCHYDINSNLFGLCDNLDIPPDPVSCAYAKAYEEDDWIATVKNDQQISLTFTAIDHCVVSEDTITPRPQACDCMLTFGTSLFFVELKNRTVRGWWEESMRQLFETINLFKAIHNIEDYNYKKAYISNNSRPFFVVSNMTEKNRFEDNTIFELLTNHIITIE